MLNYWLQRDAPLTSWLRAPKLVCYIYAMNEINQNLSKPVPQFIQFDEVNTHANP